MTDRSRVLIFTGFAPPSYIAAAQVLERLLFGMESNFGFIHPEDGISRQGLPHTFYPIKNDFQSWLNYPLLWRFEQAGWYQAAVREGMRQATTSSWDVIFASYPSLPLTLAAAKVASLTGLPLMLYFMDLFVEGRVNPVEKLWAASSEKNLITKAQVILCLTEGLQKHYSRKYGVQPILLPHCVTDAELIDAQMNRPDLVIGSPLTIAYAGGVYQARFDALLAVKKAVELLNSEGFPSRLLIFGKNDPTQMKVWGIGGAYVETHFIEDHNELMKCLRKADILLSTVAFKSAYPMQDQTCFPTKTFDYFLAGKPILVVAPGETDYIDVMKKHSSAVTITTTEPKIIAAQIQQVSRNVSLRKQIVDSGYVQLENYRLEVVRDTFRQGLFQVGAQL